MEIKAATCRLTTCKISFVILLCRYTGSLYPGGGSALLYKDWVDVEELFIFIAEFEKFNEKLSKICEILYLRRIRLGEEF